jgi:hypothetical protein
MRPFEQAWRLLKMPLYHGTTRERAEQIMREGLKPTSHAPQLFEMEPEEIQAAMIEAGRDPADYERLFGGDWNFAYGDQSGREPAISDAALYGGDDSAVIEIDENHPDAPQFMLEPHYPEIEDSDLDFFHDPLSQGFNRLKNQMRSNQTVPPSAMRILQPEEIPPSQLDLLKGHSILIGDTFHPVNQFGQTMRERARDIQTELKNTQPAKRNTGLNYYVTVPRQDLESPHSSRRYAIRRGDTDEIIGSLPMNPTYHHSRYSNLSRVTGDYKPSYSNIDPEHRGQNLYARALMGLLSAGDAGAPIVSTERNEMSEGSHRNLMDMHSRAGGNLESLSGYEPAEESDGVRYNQIFNDGYGSLRTNDPGGLPVRVIDAPSKRSGIDFAQTNLEDFSMEDERFYLPFD